MNGCLKSKGCQVISFWLNYLKNKDSHVSVLFCQANNSISQKGLILLENMLIPHCCAPIGDKGLAVRTLI